MEYNDLTIENIIDVILATPISSVGGRGKETYDKIAPEHLKYFKNDDQILDFLKNAYVEPCFFNKEFMKEREESEKNQEADFFSDDTKSYKTVDDFNRMKNEYEKFSNDFTKGIWKELRLFVLTAPKNSGKTTLAHKLISEASENIKKRKCDFEDVPTEQIRFINEIIPENFIYYRSATYSFMLLLVEEIGSLFHAKFKNNFTEEKAEQLKERVKNICEPYMRYFGNDEYTNPNHIGNYEDFFELLINFNNKNTSSISEIQIFTSELKNYFSDIIEKAFANSRNNRDEHQEENEINCIKKVAFILFVLYFCLSKSNIDEYKESKFLLFIDNVERAIMPEQDRRAVKVLLSDLSVIFKAILTALNDSSDCIKNMFRDLGQAEEPPASGVMIAMRDTTKGFFDEISNSSVHGNTVISRKIDITAYFNIVDIFKNKLKYYYKIEDNDLLNIIDTKSVQVALTAFHNIMTDVGSKSSWCLEGFVQEFYNYDMKKIAENIFRLIDSNMEYIEIFNTHWEIIRTANIQEENSYDFMYYKHIVRQFFIRLLFGYVNTRRGDIIGAFNALGEGFDSPHTRRILTYLYHKDMLIDTNELIENILVRPYRDDLTKGVGTPDMKSFVNSLYAMNLLKSTDTLWAQTLYIELSPGGNYFDYNDLSHLVETSWNTYLENKRTGSYTYAQKVEVSITDAGKMFVWFMAEFEYFSGRYAKGFTPLFAAKNLADLKRSVNKITTRTLGDPPNLEIKTVDNLIQEESAFIESAFKNTPIPVPWIFQETEDSPGEVHPKRILRRHRRYLDLFSKYLKSKYSMHLKEKNEMRVFMDSVVKKYDEKLKTLKTTHKDYMELKSSCIKKEEEA